MKTTIELPDATFRRAKAFAAGRGMTLKRFFTDAVEQQLGVLVRNGRSGDAQTDPGPPWMTGFGELRDLGEEHQNVLEAIDEEFERVLPDDVP